MLSHLTFIESNASQFPKRICFKLPRFDIEDDTPHRKVIGWTDVTYDQFFRDIKKCAKYWIKTFGPPYGATIGLWMFGMTYRDFVNFFGLVWARYVPRILNVKIRSTEGATNHFKQSGIIHVVYAPTAPVDPLKEHFQVHEMIDIGQLPALEDENVGNPGFRLSESLVEGSGDDIVMIYHTSGSTSGRPKSVPYLRKWLDANARKPVPGIPDGKEIGIAINGLSHLSQLAISLKQFENGACLVLIPWTELTGPELTQIITECKANVLYQVTPMLSGILREAMVNDELKAALMSLKFIVYGGSTFGDNERRWAVENGLPLKHLFGCTEVGITMLSGKDPTIFHPFKVPGVIYEFRCVATGSEEPADGLVEMVVPPSSLDCPHFSLCDPTDGCYYTRDVFQEVEPNAFQYRGRLDDIIFMDKGQKCDTLYLESQVLLTCKDLISVCAVVGSGRSSPILLAEPFEAYIDDISSLKDAVGKKVALINKDGFPHERIHSSRILIVPPGALPRTASKGNVSRKAAEDLFKRDIDALCAA